MRNDDIGTRQRLSPREVFDPKAHDFTAWVEENIEMTMIYTPIVDEELEGAMTGL